MSWTNLFSNQIRARAETEIWPLQIREMLIWLSQLWRSIKWAVSQEKAHPVSTRRTYKNIKAESKGSVDSTYPRCRGCFSNGAWQLSLDKLLWSVQKARTKEDKFCAAHKPHGSMSAQSRRPKSPVTQAWAQASFPGCLLAKPPCAFCMLSWHVSMFLGCW